MKNFIYYLLPFNLLFDIMTNTILPSGSIINVSRALLLFYIVYILLVNMKEIDISTFFIILFCLYVIVQIPFAKSPFVSTRISLRILISILMFPVGYYLINDFLKMKKLNNSLIILMIVYIANFIISQTFGIGFAEYTQGKEFLVGSLNDQWNTVTYTILMTPLILFTTTDKKTKLLVMLAAFIMFVLLVIGLKRTAIAGLFIGFFIFTLFSGEVIKTLIFSLVASILFIVSMPIFGNVLTKRIEKRGSRIEGNVQDIVESEARYEETIYVWAETLSFKDPIKSFFGVQAFDSVRNYAEGTFRNRQLHVDYNLILNTIGIFGLLLYFNIFIIIYIHYKKIIKGMDRSQFQKILKAMFYVVIITQFATSFGGQMYAITFRSIIFIYLGAIIGNLKTLKLKVREVY